MEMNRFPIEWGHVVAFARSVGDRHPMYELSAASQGPGALAPPTFTAAYVQFDEDWPFRPSPGVPWPGSGRTPTGVPSGAEDEAANLLHAEQRFDYHAPLRVGDELTVTSVPGETWTKSGRKGGRLTFSQHVLEFRNQHGELVVTATSTGVVTERMTSR